MKQHFSKYWKWYLLGLAVLLPFGLMFAWPWIKEQYESIKKKMF